MSFGLKSRITVEERQLDLFKDVKPIPAERKQLALFSEDEVSSFVAKEKPLVMDCDALVQWKTRIFEYQQQARVAEPTPQTTLFDLPPSHCDPDKIDPLTLQPQSMSFFRMPADYPGEACLYFVVDNAAQLILYVGETLRSNKRWKGVHACKDYIASYQDLNYKYKLPTAINITFWWDTPQKRELRQELELQLILKWRSPFNKENWERWGQPFG